MVAADPVALATATLTLCGLFYALGHVHGVRRRDHRVDQTIEGLHQAVLRLAATRLDLAAREAALEALPGESAMVAQSVTVTGETFAVVTRVALSRGRAFAFAVTPDEAQRVARALMRASRKARALFAVFELQAFGHGDPMRESPATVHQNDHSGAVETRAEAEPAVATNAPTRHGGAPLHDPFDAFPYGGVAPRKSGGEA